jgi:hypothetical protein
LCVAFQRAQEVDLHNQTQKYQQDTTLLNHSQRNPKIMIRYTLIDILNKAQTNHRLKNEHATPTTHRPKDDPADWRTMIGSVIIIAGVYFIYRMYIFHLHFILPSIRTLHSHSPCALSMRPLHPPSPSAHSHTLHSHTPFISHSFRPSPPFPPFYTFSILTFSCLF